MGTEIRLLIKWESSKKRKKCNNLTREREREKEEGEKGKKEEKKEVKRVRYDVKKPSDQREKRNERWRREMKDGTLTNTSIFSQSEPRSNSIKVVPHIPQSSRTWAFTSDVWHSGYLLLSILLLCWNAVGVFYSPNRLGREKRSNEILNKTVWK